ncbi:hypothetical protein BR93DRAFT_975677 [Coniochaeta sp. PMI_546]|nr:hypothetical protein BR93DRAFT_975677 [Coniochaeta sp. PMI_546]
MADFVHILLIESWTLFSVGILLIAARLFSRRLKLGSWKLQIEDWLMVFAGINFTGVIVSVNEVAKNGSNYMSLETALSLDEAGVAAAVYGSKMTMVLEIFTLTCLWTIKACLLLLYYRLTEAFQKQQLAVKIIACYCALGYILTMALYLGYWCTPIYEYWAVPVRISQCATYYHHMMFATAWNISSDLMLLCVPIPVIAKSQLPLKRKIILCAVLGLGILNVIIAILNRYYNFNNPDDLGYVYFYVAEVATAVFVGNVPLCWPLFRRIVQGSSWSRDASAGTDDPNKPRTRTARATGSNRFSRKRPSAHSSLWSITRGGNTQWDKMDDVEGVDSSKEHVYRNELGAVSEDQGSTIELTPGWHHEANHTTIQASRTRSSGSASTDETGDKGQVNIIRTVEITSATETTRHSRGHQAAHAI